MRGSALRASVVCAFALVWAAFVPGTAAAHAELIGSSPADGAVLQSRPPAVELTFSDPLQPSFTAVVLSDGEERQVPTAAPAVEGNKVTVAFPADASGGYTVAFRVLSQDGHSVSGALWFAVQSPAATPNPAWPVPPGPPSSSAPTPIGSNSDGGAPSQGLWWLLGVVAAGLGIGGAVFAALRRRPEESSDE